MNCIKFNNILFISKHLVFNLEHYGIIKIFVLLLMMNF